MDEDFEFDNPVTIKDYVFQALGAVSVCWENMDSTGIFQSDRAVAIGDALVERIYAIFDNYCSFDCEACRVEVWK